MARIVAVKAGRRADNVARRRLEPRLTSRTGSDALADGRLYISERG
jgi:hypothetical protein